MSWTYEDILYRSRPVSKKHPPMSAADRAAQFAPFAALTGHDAVIRETARVTDGPVELDRDRREELDAQLRELAERMGDRPRATFTHYVEDGRKEGGAYIRTTGPVRKIDIITGTVVLEDGSGIAMESIIDIDPQ